MILSTSLILIYIYLFNCFFTSFLVCITDIFSLVNEHISELNRNKLDVLCIHFGCFNYKITKKSHFQPAINFLKQINLRSITNTFVSDEQNDFLSELKKKIKIHEITTNETKTKQNWIWSIQYRTKENLNKETKKKHLVKQVISREFLNLETDLFWAVSSLLVSITIFFLFMKICKNCFFSFLFSWIVNFFYWSKERKTNRIYIIK